MSALNAIEMRLEEFANHKKLTSWLTEWCHSQNGTLAVMAGHYMLAYSPEGDRLVPLFSSAPEHDDASARERQAEIGDFPETSFRLGMELLRTCDGADSGKIALLVNDHLFPTFQSDVLRDVPIDALKRTYYRESSGLPAELNAVAADFPDVEDFMLPNNERRRKDSTLPSETIFFSENVLRTHFVKQKDAVLNYPGFEKAKAGYAGGGICYRRPGWTENYSVVPGDMECGCLGTMIMFLKQLAAKGAEKVVLFVPDECKTQVYHSIVAVLESGFVPLTAVSAVWGEAPSGGSVRFRYVNQFVLPGTTSSAGTARWV